MRLPRMGTPCWVNEKVSLASTLPTKQGGGAHPVMPDTTEPPKPPCFVRHRVRIFILLLLTLLIGWIIVDQTTKPCLGCSANSTSVNGTAMSSLGNTTCELTRKQACLNRGFDVLTEWIGREPVVGSVVLTFVLTACAVVLIPASALTLGAGAAFASALGLGTGVAVGTAVVFVGLSMGALLAFLVARYLLRDLAQRQLQKWRITSAINAALDKNGLKVMLLLRLSPLIPYNFFNYIIAATSVSFRDYALALPAMLPATAGYVYIGAAIACAAYKAAEMADEDMPEETRSADGVQIALFVVLSLIHI